ncbi:MAG: response regulator [Verrucomicrobiales bacterium]|nr:response regulator [Verrucomicrobiales bacterium]
MSDSALAGAGGAVDPPTSRPSLAKIRHELRTPVNHIIGYSEILREEAEGLAPASFLQDLERIDAGGHRLLALIGTHLGEDAPAPARANWRELHHELRTPVHQVIGYSELLAERCDELGLLRFKPDLERIRAAAAEWLRLMETRLGEPVPETPPATASRHPGDTEFAETRFLRRTDETGSSDEPAARVLVTDDDAANRDLLCRRLRRLGYEPVPCEDGARLLEALRQEPADVVLLDMLMPGLNGEEVLCRLKADENLRDIPVVVVSALDETEGIARCIALGAEDYLTKPVEPALLRARLSVALEKKRLRDAEQGYLRQIEQERARSDRLLLNVLPRPAAERLKHGETMIVDRFPEVTVLFGDLVGFTTFASQHAPERVVELLNEVFSTFDDLAARFGLEKIKTIGDAYMGVAGLPESCPDHAVAAARMALGMLRTLDAFNACHRTAMQMRIGLNTGSVIAGIIGRHKFSYDLWGDTVNIASRMESQGEPGVIQLTESTAALLQGRFELRPRGPVLIKGRGRMATFLLGQELGARS